MKHRSLLHKYDRPGPRYTSYPTAPIWTDSFSDKDYAERLLAAGKRADTPVSLYVHIPYCEQMCWFCGCTTIITKDHDKEDSYIDTVLAEARLVRETMGEQRRVTQHHWGGGTPTFLAPEAIEKLFTGLCLIFPPTTDAEISIEVDPRVTTRAHLETLKRIGFNRISMGLQDFNPKVQKTIHREQSYEQTEAIIEGARELGFISTNVDLIYGLPYQTPESFAANLELVHQLNPDRIACYSYAHVPWLKKHQNVIEEDTLPKGADKLELYLLALESFSARGYDAIGMDHFAKSDDELSVAARAGKLHRNFMGYSTHPAEEMISFGMSAISEVDGAFAHNFKEIKPWKEAIDAGRLPIDRGLRRSAEDERRRKLILSLMCNFHADFKDHGGVEDFKQHFAKELTALQDMQNDGLVELHADSITVTKTGRLFVRNICMLFDAYLNEPKKSDGPQFSRTV